MFARLVAESLVVRWRRKLAAVGAVALGTAGATALLALFLGVGDLVARELRRTGANLDVRVPGGTLAEADLPKLKDHTWKHNILGYVPFLPVEADVNGRRVAVLGTRTPDLGPGDVIADASLGLRAGDRVRIAGRDLTVRRVGTETLVDLSVAQAIAGRPGRVGYVLVSALVTPESELGRLLHPGESAFAVARQMRTDPTKVRDVLREKLTCTPFPTTIALQIEGAIPGVDARPIRRVTESEGAVLGRVRGIFLLLALSAAVAGGLGVLAAMTASVVERRKEIGLMKALGATDADVAALVLAEAAIIGLVGGLVGFGLGFAAAQAIGRHVFAAPPPVPPALAILTLLVAVAISLAGTAWPLRQAVRVEPQLVLHEV